MTVDFHTHYIDPSVESLALPGCVALRRDGASGQLLRDGAVYRVIDERSWSVERRIGEMDDEGVALQVLSPIPVSYGYEASAADAAAFCRAQNDALAAVVRARPDRFAALGVVPLQDPQLACAELDRAMSELGLHGVEIGTTAGGRELDDPELDAFWERCEASGAIVFVHPESAPGFDRLRRRMMVISTAYPSETGNAAAMLLTSGVLERRKLRIVLAHGGGTLPWLLPRLDRLWEVSDELRAAGGRPSEIARAFYCDTLTFDERNLALILERFDPSHIVVGSDYPFTVRETPPGAVVDAFPQYAAALRCENARALLAAIPSAARRSP
jgi:aminocarboxymuconate-semialdehyde decarboxylase